MALRFPKPSVRCRITSLTGMRNVVGGPPYLPRNGRRPGHTKETGFGNPYYVQHKAAPPNKKKEVSSYGRP